MLRKHWPQEAESWIAFGIGSHREIKSSSTAREKDRWKSPSRPVCFSQNHPLKHPTEYHTSIEITLHFSFLPEGTSSMIARGWPSTDLPSASSRCVDKDTRDVLKGLLSLNTCFDPSVGPVIQLLIPYLFHKYSSRIVCVSDTKVGSVSIGIHLVKNICTIRVHSIETVCFKNINLYVFIRQGNKKIFHLQTHCP